MIRFYLEARNVEMNTQAKANVGAVDIVVVDKPELHGYDALFTGEGGHDE
jgi:hypothetical protein